MKMVRLFLILASILIMAEVTVARPQNVMWPQPAQLLTLPYYGGAKGQYLQIARDQNGGTLAQRVFPAGNINSQQQQQQQFVVNQNQIQSQQFVDSLRNIQASAQRLVELQKKTTKSGQLKSEDQKVYATQLALLGEAASNLAELGNKGEYDLSQLFITKNNIDGNEKKKQDLSEDEEDVGEEQEGDGSTDVDDQDSIQIAAPDSASVAEAKPVGVAIVGDGGVASSKPVATAVVGPGGLAIARPVATAIAGVDPNSVGFGNKFPISAKTPATNTDTVSTSALYQPLQYLASPQYYINPQQLYNSQFYPIDLAIY